jgi:hypothetical protein
MSGANAELAALCLKWRARAREYIADAELSHRGADIVQLTAMASTLNHAADDLSFELERLKPPPSIEHSG